MGWQEEKKGAQLATRIGRDGGSPWSTSIKSEPSYRSGKWLIDVCCWYVFAYNSEGGKKPGIWFPSPSVIHSSECQPSQQYVFTEWQLAQHSALPTFCRLISVIIISIVVHCDDVHCCPTR